MGEEKKDASQLRGVHHLLTQGKSDEAQIVLAQMTTETSAQRKELDYLQAWRAAGQERWEDATRQVKEIPVLLLSKEERDNLLTNGSVRRRRPVCLLVLGEIARELGYPEEAIEHIQRSLIFLNERRMNVPEARLLAHFSLGRLSLEMNQTAQALIQYETARSLCGENGSEPPLLAEILTGLCETYIRLEQFDSALAYGKQALRLLQENAASGCQEHLLLLLSRISLALKESASALAYAQDAKNMADLSNDPARMANALLALAEIQYQEHRMEEARANCQQAQALLSGTRSQPLSGTAFFLLGKVAEAEWRARSEEKLAEEALQWYEQACVLFEAQPDPSSLASVSKQLAQLLEDRGQPELALTHWKNAFRLSQPRS